MKGGSSLVTVEKEKKVSNLFLSQYASKTSEKTVWIIDSGCSNYMTTLKSLFVELDESHKLSFRLGDDKEIAVEGRGMVAINIGEGHVKLLHDVQYVPSLAHILFCLGQLFSIGFSMVFNGDTCSISEKNSVELVIKVW